MEDAQMRGTPRSVDTEDEGEFGDVFDDKDIDDEVVAEYDVHLARVDEAELYLLQYPLRPVYRPYGDEGQLTTVEHRKLQKRLRVTYSLNRDSDNFDQDAVHAGVDRHVLVGRSSVRCSASQAGMTVQPNNPYTSYGVGLLKGSTLYIAPLTTINQLRPDFAHVNAKAKEMKLGGVRGAVPGREDGSGDVEMGMDDEQGATEGTGKRPSASAKAKAKADASDAAAASSSSSSSSGAAGAPAPGGGESAPAGDDNNGASPIEVMFKKLDKHDPSAQARVTYAQRLEAEESEPWQPLYYYDADSAEASEIVNLLCSTSISTEEDKQDAMPVERPPLNFNDLMTPYVDALCSLTDKQESFAAGRAAADAGGAQTSGPISYISLSRLTIDQQILRVLTHLQAVTMDHVKRLVTKSLPDDQLVEMLKEFAVLVKGNWVVKSAHVCEGYDAMCRDLILLLLNQPHSAGLHRQKIVDAVGLPAQRISELLAPLADLNMGQWYFKLPPDETFKGRFPKVIQANDAYFEERKPQLLKEIAKRQTTAKATGQKQQVDTALTGLITDILKEGGMTLAMLKDTAQQRADERKIFGPVARAVSQQEVADCLPAIAVEIRGLWVLQKLGDPQVDTYRDVLMSLFRRCPALTKADILKEMATTTRRQFNLPDFTFRKLLREFAVSEGGYWRFKGDILSGAPATAST